MKEAKYELKELILKMCEVLCVSMRIHHRVCSIPDRPRSQPRCWPWLAGAVHLYCCFTAPPLLPRLTIQVQRSLHCLLKAWAVRHGEIPALPAWTWNLYCGRLSHHYIHFACRPSCASFIQPEAPFGPPSLCGTRLVPGRPRRAQTRTWIYFIWGGSKFYSPTLFFWPRGPVSMCVQDLKDTRNPFFVWGMWLIFICLGKRGSRFKPFEIWETFEIHDHSKSRPSSSVTLDSQELLRFHSRVSASRTITERAEHATPSLLVLELALVFYTVRQYRSGYYLAAQCSGEKRSLKDDLEHFFDLFWERIQGNGWYCFFVLHSGQGSAAGYWPCFHCYGFHCGQIMFFLFHFGNDLLFQEQLCIQCLGIDSKSQMFMIISPINY